jgi:aminoglycoside phosphotransferase (APT) family kinase protein
MGDVQLPSTAEILESTEILSSQGGCKVVKVRDNLVVKYGRRVSLLEAETMRFVAANSDVPIPKLLGTLTDPETNVNYIVKEFITGQCLDAIWHDLTTSEQGELKEKLKIVITRLRQIPDQGYIGSVGRTKCIDGVFHTGSDQVPSKNGSFMSEHEMNEGVLRRLAETHPQSSIRLFRAILSNMPTHRIVFTHADLQGRNIIARRTNSDIEGHGKLELTIIDWEMSGWYPEYWEFCNSLIFNTFATEWNDIIQDTLDVYTNEYLWNAKSSEHSVLVKAFRRRESRCAQSGMFA